MRRKSPIDEARRIRSEPDLLRMAATSSTLCVRELSSQLNLEDRMLDVGFEIILFRDQVGVVDNTDHLQSIPW